MPLTINANLSPAINSSQSIHYKLSRTTPTPTPLIEYGLSPAVVGTYAALGVATVITNGVFMTVIWRNRHLRSATNYILFSLALSDLLVGAVITPMNLLNFMSVLVVNEMVCVLMNCLVSSVSLVSLFHLLAVTSERYIAIIHAIHHSRIVTTKRTVCVLMACWIIGVGIGAMPIFGWNRLRERHQIIQDSIDSNERFCTFVQVIPSVYIMMSIYIQIFTSIVIVVLYAHIFIVARKQANEERRVYLRNSVRGSRWKDAPRSHQSRDVKVIVVLFATVGYFLASFFPMWIMCLMFTYGYIIDLYVWKIVLFLTFTNSAINPFIYGLGNGTIRHAFIGMLPLCCGCKPDDDMTPAHASSAAGVSET